MPDEYADTYGKVALGMSNLFLQQKMLCEKFDKLTAERDALNQQIAGLREDREAFDNIIKSLQDDYVRLNVENSELRKTTDAFLDKVSFRDTENMELRNEVQRLTGDLALSMAGKAMLNKTFDELQAVMEAEIERLTLNLKLCKDDSAEMDRRRLAEDALLRAENARLRAAIEGIFAKPYGCPMCDSGVLRDPKKDHWDDCSFYIARKELEPNHE